MRSSDLASLLTPEQAAAIGMRYGRVIAWNPQVGTNQIEMGGQIVEDLPVLAGGAVMISVGDTVGLLRYESTYAVVGRFNAPGNQHGNFMVPGIVGLSTTKFAQWPTTTSGSFEELWSGWVRRSGNEFAFFARTYAGPSTNGEYDVLVDGVQIATDTVTGGGAGSLGTFTEQLPWPGETDWTNAHTISFRARRTSGAGNVAMVVQGLFVT